ncbi:MAG TPA: hypothetical protein VIM73_11390 [Polyangiaceae bacterium]
MFEELFPWVEDGEFVFRQQARGVDQPIGEGASCIGRVKDGKALKFIRSGGRRDPKVRQDGVHVVRGRDSQATKIADHRQFKGNALPRTTRITPIMEEWIFVESGVDWCRGR